MNVRNNNKRQLYICFLKNILIVFLFFCKVNISFAATKVIPYFKKTVCSDDCETLDSTDSHGIYCKVCDIDGDENETVTYGKQSSANDCQASATTRCDTRYFTHNTLEIL